MVHAYLPVRRRVSVQCRRGDALRYGRGHERGDSSFQYSKREVYALRTLIARRKACNQVAEKRKCNEMLTERRDACVFADNKINIRVTCSRDVSCRCTENDFAPPSPVVKYFSP